MNRLFIKAGAYIAETDEDKSSAVLERSQLSSSIFLSLTNASEGQTFIVVVLETLKTFKNTIGGVIQVVTTESNEVIMKWVRCEQGEILRLQKIGKADRAV